MSVFCMTQFCKSASFKDTTKHAFLKQSSLLPALPLLASHGTSDCCEVRSCFRYWGTAKCVCVQLQVSVLGVRPTKLCVHLQETADETTEETWLVISQQRFCKGFFCVTRCSCLQRADSRHQHTVHGRTWDMTWAVASLTSCSRAEERSPWRTSKQQRIHQPHTQKREPQACWVFSGMGLLPWKQKLNCNYTAIGLMKKCQRQVTSNKASDGKPQPLKVKSFPRSEFLKRW